MDREKQAEPITVSCQPTSDGWSCAVGVGAATDATEHVVEVANEEMERLAPGTTDPTRLVQASIEFLLEHEPKESILPRFGLRTIASYFPSYPAEIRSRL
jgi:hypothetical protein